MPVSLHRIETTGVEPVTLDEMKNHLRVDFTDDDDLITSLIVAARQRAEDITGRTLVNSTWVYCRDSFPYNWQTTTAPSRAMLTEFCEWWANAQTIRLPKTPVIAVQSVQYVQDTTQSYVTLDPTLYVVDTLSVPSMIYPAANYYWPPVYVVKDAVKITYTAGCDVSDIPEPIKVAIRMMVAFWYEQREDTVAVPKVAEYLLASYRVQACGLI